MNRKGRKRLSIDIPTSIYEKMKELTEKRNCTVTRWVLRAISSKIKLDNKYN